MAEERDQHEGVVVLAPDSGPLLWGTDDGGWVAYSWSEWDARVASGARVREARKLLSELSDAEACDLEEFFLAGAEGAELAKVFYLRHPRTGFRFFMGLSEDGRVLAWRDPDYDYEAAELLEAAMRQRGALVTREDGDYWQTAHPMVRRLAEVAVKVQMPERKGAGILA